MRRARIFHAFLTAGLLFSTACQTGPNPDLGEPLPFEQEKAVLDAVGEMIDALPDADEAAENQAILDILRSRAEILDSGISDDSCVWGRLPGGEMLLVINNRDTSVMPELVENGLPPLPTKRLGATGRPSDTDADRRRMASARAQTTADVDRDGSVIVGRPAPPALTATRDSPEPGAAPSKRLGPQGIPLYDQAYILSTIPPGESTHAARLISHMMETAGYRLNDEGARPAAEDWLSFNLCGVFYIDAHGGTLQNANGETAYALMSNIEVNAANRALFTAAAAEIDPQIRVRSRHFNKWFYAITPEFVDRFFPSMFTPRSSFVFINACNSNAPAAAALRNAFFRQGATSYGGWSGRINSVHGEAGAVYTFDRMLGANQQFYVRNNDGAEDELLPPLADPPLRPFGLSYIFSDAANARKPDNATYRAQGGPAGQPYSQAEARDHGQLVNSSLVVFTNPSVTDPNHATSLLAPSIAYCEIDEFEGRLVLHDDGGGGFGPDPRGAAGSADLYTVTVGGVDLHDQIESWEDDKIVIRDLSATGAGSAGEVRVRFKSPAALDGRRLSNPRYITAFNGVKSTWRQTGPGSLFQELKWTVRIRGDFGSYRSFPGDEPQPLDVYTAACEGDSSFTYMVGGSYLDDNDTDPTNDDCTEGWSSNGVMPEIFAHDVRHAGDCPEDSYCFGARILQDDGSSVIIVEPFAWLLDAYHWTLTCSVGPPGMTDFDIGGGSQVFTGGENGEDVVPFDVATGWGSASGMDMLGGTLHEWDMTAPASVESPPDPFARQ